MTYTDQVASYIDAGRAMGCRGPLDRWNWIKDEPFYVEPGQHHVGLWISKPKSYSNLMVTTLGNAGKSGCPLLVDSLMENCLIEDGQKWGERGYRYQRRVVRRRNTYRTIRQEHGFYVNIAGRGVDASAQELSEPTATIELCRFEGCDSQGVQFVGFFLNRAGETDDPENDATAGGPIQILQNWFDCCTRPDGARSATVISFGEPVMCPIEIKRNAIDCRTHYSAFGAIVTVGFDGTEGYGNYAQWVDLIDNIVWIPVGDRPLINSQKTGNARVIRNALYCKSGHPQPWVDFRNPLPGCTIEVQGNTAPWSDVRLRVNGEDKGSITQDQTITVA